MRSPTLILAFTSLAALAAPEYKVTHAFVLGGEGRWDYVVPDRPPAASSSRARAA